MPFVVNWRTSGVVNGIRGQSYPTLGIWSLCPWTPVTLLMSPSYPTFTGKVILELRGRLPQILWALRCSWTHMHLHGVTGTPYREVNSKVATAPNTQSRR